MAISRRRLQVASRKTQFHLAKLETRASDGEVIEKGGRLGHRVSVLLLSWILCYEAQKSLYGTLTNGAYGTTNVLLLSALLAAVLSARSVCRAFLYARRSDIECPHEMHRTGTVVSPSRIPCPPVLGSHRSPTLNYRGFDGRGHAVPSATWQAPRPPVCDKYVRWPLHVSLGSTCLLSSPVRPPPTASTAGSSWHIWTMPNMQDILGVVCAAMSCKVRLEGVRRMVSKPTMCPIFKDHVPNSVKYRYVVGFRGICALF